MINNLPQFLTLENDCLNKEEKNLKGIYLVGEIFEQAQGQPKRCLPMTLGNISSSPFLYSILSLKKKGILCHHGLQKRCKRIELNKAGTL